MNQPFAPHFSQENSFINNRFGSNGHNFERAALLNFRIAQLLRGFVEGDVFDLIDRDSLFHVMKLGLKFDGNFDQVYKTCNFDYILSTTNPNTLVEEINSLGVYLNYGILKGLNKYNSLKIKELEEDLEEATYAVKPGAGPSVLEIVSRLRESSAALQDDGNELMVAVTGVFNDMPDVGLTSDGKQLVISVVTQMMAEVANRPAKKLTPEWISNLREVTGRDEVLNDISSKIAQLPGVKDGYFPPLSSLLWLIKEYGNSAKKEAVVETPPKPKPTTTAKPTVAKPKVVKPTTAKTSAELVTMAKEVCVALAKPTRAKRTK